MLAGNVMLLYVSDDGHVRYAGREPPSQYLVEPYLPERTPFSDDPPREWWWAERRYSLRKLAFPTTKDRREAEEWAGQDEMNLKWLWLKANNSDGIVVQYP